MEEIIKAINAHFPDTLNGAVLLHMDKETHEPKTISPLMPVENIEDLYMKLAGMRDAIQVFLNDMVNKGLFKQGRGN